MVRLANTTSGVVRFALWLFAFTVFADAANLEDFLAGVVVMHVDESGMNDGDSPGNGSPDLCKNSPFSPQAWNSAGHTTAATPKVIYDQESPSLSAESSLPRDLQLFLPGETQVVRHIPVLSREALHLRFCTLLL